MAWPTIAIPNQIKVEFYKAADRSKFESGRQVSGAKDAAVRRRFTLIWERSLPQTDLDSLGGAFETDQGGTFAWTHPISATSYTVGYGQDSIEGHLYGKDIDRYSCQVILEEQ